MTATLAWGMSAAAQWMKRSALASGHYRRVLRGARFPGVAVLGYHGLRRDDWSDGAMPFENLHVRESTFESHCRVVRETCDPISLDDWRAALSGATRLPPRPVLMTFDDGYRSVFSIGAPILAAYRLPAVVFACSEPIARRALLWFDAVAARDGEDAVQSWRDRDHASWLASWGGTTPPVADDDPRAVMREEEIGTLSRQGGVEIGAHTARHGILSRATPAEQREEIAGSRDALERWTARPIRAFAYPNGRPGIDYTADTVAILGDLGFDFAFTTRPAFATPAEPALERSRFIVVSEVTAAELSHRLAYSWPR
jgi:peptidoglycan/xylan/chitin deacetylase (PgdA/CDA1 family)